METFHQQSSKLYQPYRIAGVVCNDVPLCTRDIRRSDDTWISTAVDNVFLSFSSRKLHLMCFSSPLDAVITSLAADFHYVYAGTARGDVFAFKRGRIPANSYLHTHQTDRNAAPAAAKHIVPCGDQVLVVYADNSVRLWQREAETSSPPVWELTLPVNEFEITAVIHPSGYVNKILFGSRQGSMQLWNIRSGQMIYEFSSEHVPKFRKVVEEDDADNDHVLTSGITAMAQSLVVDVIAIGYSNGAVVVHNLKYDRALMEFNQTVRSANQETLSSTAHHAVTSIAFRKDVVHASSGGSGANDKDQQRHELIVGTAGGSLIFWDLDKCQLIAEIRDAHRDAVTGLVSYADEPIFATSSPDNSLKLWIMDGVEPGARVLTSREGHSGQARRVRFFDDEGAMLLSAGEDSTLRVFSTVTDHLNASLGTACFSRKSAKKRGVKRAENLHMPAISQFDFSTARDEQWDNIVACHDDTARISKWSMHDRRMSEALLLNGSSAKREALGDSTTAKLCATSVCVAACGNFCFIGYNAGAIDKFNMQSNIYRGSCEGEAPKKSTDSKIAAPNKYEPSAIDDTEFSTEVSKLQRRRRDAKNAKKLTLAHAGVVTGVQADLLSTFLVSGGTDKTLKLWNFHTLACQHTVKFSAAPVMLALKRENSLLCVAFENFNIIIFDCITRRVVRRLFAHTAPITDVAFSPNGDWLLSASLDRTIRTWDLALNATEAINILHTNTPCLSVSMSPTSQFIATTHAGSLGVWLWHNRRLYENAGIFDRQQQKSSEISEAMDDTADGEVDVERKSTKTALEVDELNGMLCSLSLEARYKWFNFHLIDKVRERNRPREPPKIPKAAPFFLPNAPIVDPALGSKSDADKKNLPAATDAVKSNATIAPTVSELSGNSNFQRALLSSNFEAAFQTIRSMGASAASAEIGMLRPVMGGSVKLMCSFLDMLHAQLERKANVGLCAAYLANFFNHPNDLIKPSDDNGDDEDTTDTSLRLRKKIQNVNSALDSAWSAASDAIDESLAVVQYLKSAVL